ncbi:multicilin [Clinocottus analis]|uniref:multicilin n=1 Tax=Clinocottus analis TaxID=304258 RepID=UPI0035C1090D
METHRDCRAFGVARTSQAWSWRAAGNAKDKLVPRSSSPVGGYVELPCVIEQAFSTIAWDDLEDCASAGRRERDSLGSQVNDSDGDDQDFGDYALDFMADSPATLESSLSPAELVPFQGCALPLLGPPQCIFSAPEGAPWLGTAHQGRALGESMEVNTQLHETLRRRQEEIDSLREQNLPLRQLASRAKHLASMLEELMTVQEPRATPCGGRASPGLSCKRQRLDEGYETEPSDSVEDVLRDISTRCNAVLHGANAGKEPPPTPPTQEAIRMHGAFSGLQMSSASGSSAGGGGGDESVSCFRTSVREHCTMRTRVFPHGRAFTSTTPQGGHRFRWVPDHS